MRRKLSNSVGVRLFKLNYDKVMEELKRYAKRIIRDGRAKAVILVGSLARGDYTAFSDADVIIIADNVPRRPVDRIAEFIDPTLSIDIQPIVYTTREILKMAEEKRRIVREVVKYGILLAGDKTILATLARKLKDEENK